VDPILIGFIAYLFLVLLIGLLTYARNKTPEDFFLGGRKLGPWVIAFSERASGESAWILIGFPGAAFFFGLGQVWTALGCVLGIAFSWLFIARGLRRETEAHEAITLPEYFARKFDPDSNAIRLVAASIIVFFFTLYVAAQFNASGKVLNATFGIPELWGMVLGAVVILLYTLMGGFFAVAWTDFLQGAIMIGTLVFLPLVAFIELGQRGGAGAALAAPGSDYLSWVGGEAGIWAVLTVVSGLSWGLGYLGQPHLVLRYMALRSPEDTRVGSRVAIGWAAPAFAGSFLIGILGLALYGSGVLDGVLDGDREKLMPFMAKDLLPAWLAGIFISGAIAAMMSTADSQLLVATSAVGEDIYHRVMGREPGEAKLVLISRIVILGAGALGLLFAMTTQDLVIELVSYAWGGLGASFGPIIVLSLYWGRLNKGGVLGGMLTGSLGTVFWKNVAVLQGAVPERLAAFVLAFLAAVVCSLAAERRPARR
jgi:sodium/proline symporter